MSQEVLRHTSPLYTDVLMTYVSGGIASHISPFVTPQDIGSLLNSANFCMITLDCDEMTVTYPDLYYLLRDLQVFIGVHLICFILQWSEIACHHFFWIEYFVIVHQIRKKIASIFSHQAKIICASDFEHIPD